MATPASRTARTFCSALAGLTAPGKDRSVVLAQLASSRAVSATAREDLFATLGFRPANRPGLLRMLRALVRRFVETAGGEKPTHRKGLGERQGVELSHALGPLRSG
jgi:hypothetical protein